MYVTGIGTMSFLCVSEPESGMITYIGTETDDQW